MRDNKIFTAAKIRPSSNFNFNVMQFEKRVKFHYQSMEIKCQRYKFVNRAPIVDAINKTNRKFVTFPIRAYYCKSKFQRERMNWNQRQFFLLRCIGKTNEQTNPFN